MAIHKRRPPTAYDQETHRLELELQQARQASKAAGSRLIAAIKEVAEQDLSPIGADNHADILAALLAEFTARLEERAKRYTQVYTRTQSKLPYHN